MANDVTANPMILDTDFASFQALLTAASASSPVRAAFRVRRLTLAVGTGGASSAGHVDITVNNAGARALYPPLAVAASVAARQILISDGPWNWDDALDWPDFGIAGLTATGTRLFLWLRTS